MDDDVADDLSIERAAFDVKREGFELFRAACLMGRVEGRAVDVQGCVETIEEWAANIRTAAGDVDDTRARLLHHLFHDLRLRGDAAFADEPAATFVDQALEARRGSPIALSLITLAVAEAAGLPAFPVMLPDHVVTGLGRHDSFLLVDAFAGGRLLTLDDVYRHSDITNGEGLAEAIAASTAERVLMRMLASLHACYLRRRERGTLVRVLSRMLIFDPRNVGLWLQRAQVRLEDADFAGAADDLHSARQLPLVDEWLRVADDLARRIEQLGTTMQ